MVSTPVRDDVRILNGGSLRGTRDAQQINKAAGKVKSDKVKIVK